MATYYVAKNGNDSNPGTKDLPWRTCAKAATAIAGSIVYFKPGVWNERLIPMNSGTSTAPIVFSIVPGSIKNSVILDGISVIVPKDNGMIHIYDKNYITIDGFKIQYVKGTSHNHGNGIIIGGSSSNIIIKNNYLYDIFGSGINLFGIGASNITIDNNELEMIGNRPKGIWSQEEMSIWGVNGAIISNNHIHHNAYWYNQTLSDLGIEGLDIKDGASNVKCYGNHIHHMDNAWNMQTALYVGTYTGTVSNIEVYNNIIHDIKGFCYGFNVEKPTGKANNVYFYNNIAYKGNDIPSTDWAVGYRLVTVHPPDINLTAFTNTYIYNNVAYGFKGTPTPWKAIGFQIGERVSNNTIVRNNISFECAYTYIYKDRVIQDHNFLSGDPLFVNPSMGDFHLQPGSPCIGAGITTSITFDADGNLRPSPPSIGAYEYGALPPPPPVIVPPKKYKCDGAPFYQCKEDATGEYDTLEACNSACAIQRPTLSSIIVTPGMATISMGDSLVVVGTAIDSQGNTMGGIPIVWSSDPAGVVEIDPINTATFIDGKISTKIKGILAGMCIIKGTSNNISGQLILDVNVSIPPPPPPPTPPPDITEERSKNEKIVLAALAALSFLR